ncbi:response regulator transcription factor [Lapidilactobacillus wuchangensis]|uniref:response regulator transcription factor n=1 Tax=Lapidilactobacillus wuchangensis TaxID=2486001 RepID=UPI000F76C4F4|nr:response regulator [Lapidilactobacillus wuchangensis]
MNSEPRLIIIDDERLNANGIEMIIRRSNLPVNICDVFYSSSSALKYLSENQVDIILTDIKMPKISGLQLLGELKKRSITAEVIVFTGYGSLTYAQEAMNYGVKYFIEKPVLPSMLCHSIEECIKDWQQHTIERELKLKEILENVLFDECQKVSIRIPSFDLLVFSELKFSKLHDLIDDYLNKNNYKYCRINRSGNVLYCLFTRIDYGVLFRKIANNIHGEPIAISFYTDTTISNIKNKFLMSKRITNFDFYLQHPKMFVNEIIDEEVKQTKLFTQLYLQLKRSMAGQGLHDISYLFTAFGDKCCECGIEPNIFRRNLERQLYNQMIKADLPKDLIAELTKEVLGTKDITSVIIVVKRAMKELSDLNNSQLQKVDIVGNLNTIIREQYGFSDLSLKWISNNLLFLNADYLGKKYLQISGEKFSNVLLRVRMQNAAELLQKNYKIYEVAVLVGFENNPDYFSQQFKRFFHLTPHQYCNNLKNRQPSKLN